MDFIGNIKAFLEKLRIALLKGDRPVILLIYFITIFLNYAVFLPNLSDLNPWDEAAYLHEGRMLVQSGEWPPLAGNPLTTLFFALTYLPFRSSTLWMVHSASLAKFLLLSLIWLGAYLVARELNVERIALGIFLITPLGVEMLRYPSDPLFASLAALALWKLLKFNRYPDPKYLLHGSVFIALAALARVDGLILFAIFLVFGAALNARKNGNWKGYVGLILPFALIIAGSILINGLIMGDLKTGISERTYENFESGQQLVYVETSGISPVVGSRLEARELFGTAEENHNSVFRAIARNPAAYGDRVLVLLKSLPERVLNAYGIRFAAVIFLLALRGILELLRKKEWLLTAVLVVWPLHLVTGFVITILRSGHLQFHFYIVFAFAALGLQATLNHINQEAETRWVSVILLAFALYGLLDNKLAIYYGAALTFVAIWVVKLFQDRKAPSEVSALLLFLCVGVILRGGFPSPKLRQLGIDPKEQAVVFLAENYPSDTFVGAGSPGVVWASNMRYAGLASTDVPVGRDPEGFLQWLRDQGIELIYVDHDLTSFSPAVWTLVEPLIDNGLERVFILEDGDFQILNVSRGP